MFPKDISNKLEAIPVNKSLTEKLMMYEAWKNTTGNQENTPKVIDMFAEWLIKREEERKPDPCKSCGFWDSDYEGCTCYSTDKWYACPIESEKLTEEDWKSIFDESETT